jgi:ribosomal protein L11 methyltransferase
MFSLYLECRQEVKDLLIAELWERGSGGITESDLPGGRSGLRAFFQNEADAESLMHEFASWSPQWQRGESCDWVAIARSQLVPQCVGSRFFLVPEWRDDPAPHGRFRIEINPGMAFGTGVHESTQLCMEALERELKPGAVVLDLGTGSGILAKAARLLGASQVIACDVDPVAIELAREPLSFIGSADAVRSASVDLIVANISPEAVIWLAPEIVRSLRTPGVMIVSGFEVDESLAIETALCASGATVCSPHSKGDWSAIVASS